MSRFLDVPATMEAYEQADLYAKASGYISEVRVDIGDPVKEGDVLAIIDVPEMLKELAEAQALHAAAVAGVATAESKIVQAKKMHDVAGSMLVRAQARLRYAESVVRYNQSQIKLLAALGLYAEAAVASTAPVN